MTLLLGGRLRWSSDPFQGDPKEQVIHQKDIPKKRVVFFCTGYFGDRIPRTKNGSIFIMSGGAGLMTIELSHCGSIGAIASS